MPLSLRGGPALESVLADLAACEPASPAPPRRRRERRPGRDPRLDPRAARRLPPARGRRAGADRDRHRPPRPRRSDQRPAALASARRRRSDPGALQRDPRRRRSRDRRRSGRGGSCRTASGPSRSRSDRRRRGRRARRRGPRRDRRGGPHPRRRQRRLGPEPGRRPSSPGSAATRLELVEQPCADLAGLAYVRANLRLPIVADESVASLAEAEDAARTGACDAATVKLAKVGGLLEALRIAAVVPTYLSSALDGPIGIAAAAHLVQALPREGSATRLRARSRDAGACSPRPTPRTKV